MDKTLLTLVILLLEVTKIRKLFNGTKKSALFGGFLISPYLVDFLFRDVVGLGLAGRLGLGALSRSTCALRAGR